MLLEYLELGKIVSTHGIKGELRVQPWCDSPDFFMGFETVYLDKKDNTEYTMKSSRPHGNVMLMTLDGIDDVDKAAALRGKIIYVKRADAPLEPGRYFIAELIGCRVVDADDESLCYGEITDVTNTGASDIWHISKENKEYLLPSIPEVVISVDVASNLAKIKPLRGIFEEAEEIHGD